MEENRFIYEVESFADIRILRYKVDGFDSLNVTEKKLIYFLSQATLAGRDILWDQNYRYNLQIRELLETIFRSYNGCRSCSQFAQFTTYMKRVWFSNGIHHHYSMDKINPSFDRDYLIELIEQSDAKELSDIVTLVNVITDRSIDSKRVSLNSETDLITESANNYYNDISQEEAELFYADIKEREGSKLEWGLNSTLCKKDGKLYEDVWRIGGKYSAAIEEIVYWLKRAAEITENSIQRNYIELLIEYYTTGDLQKFVDYSIEWIADQDSKIDFINGFIEVYGDPLGIKGSWEAIVNKKNETASKRTEIISDNAQWFEDNSPSDPKHKKENVTGVSAKVIDIYMLGGDCHPYTPIGINLPNAEWIRESYGSKSVTIDNVTEAYHNASLNSNFLTEYAYSVEEVERAKAHGNLAGNLHTDLHECLGHGSGKILDGVSSDALKSYSSTIEETRADLFALYYIIDNKLEEIGLTTTDEVGKCEYDSFIRNGLLTQLVRVEEGKDLEESHMRNRQLIAAWAFEMGDGEVIKRVKKDDKTFFIITDYYKLREIFGEQLAEIQRVKSEGDYNRAKELVESYGVVVDTQIHTEVLERFKKVNQSPYSGFVNPIYYPELDSSGEISDIKFKYEESFTAQMLDYSNNHSFLI